MIAPMSGLGERTTVRIASGLLAATALIAVAGAAMTVVAWRDLALGDALPNMGSAFASVVYAVLGALIVRRVHNLIGWILLGEGFGLAFLSFASAYSVIGMVTQPGTLPDPKLVGVLAEWSFVPIASALAFLFFFFPTGTLPSSRWRPVVTLGIVATALMLVAFVVAPRPVALPAPAGVSLTFPNPLGIQSPGNVLSTVPVGTLSGVAVLSAVLLAGAFAALVTRYRAGDRELRQQVKWIAFAAVGTLVC